MTAPVASVNRLCVIFNTVCQVHEITPEDMWSRRRTLEIAHARQVGMYLCRKFTKASLQDIGNVFNRDHGTVMWALNAVENRRDVDKHFAADLSIVEQAVNTAIRNMAKI